VRHGGHGHRHLGDEESDKSKWELLKSSARLLRYLRPYWHIAVALLLISIVSIGLDLMRPWLFGVLIDKAILPGD